MLTPLPCPFCGASLRMVGSLADRSVPVTWQHPRSEQEPPCPYSQHAIGHALIPRWNRRALSYTLQEDGLPVFDDTAQGRPVTVAELNQFFMWWAEKVLALQMQSAYKGSSDKET